MWIPRCGGLLQSGFLISGTWIPEIPVVCETPDSLGCIQRPKPRIPDYLTSDKIVNYVLSWSGSPSSQIKLSQKLLWPIHTQFPAALFAPVKGLAGRGSRGGGGELLYEVSEVLVVFLRNRTESEYFYHKAFVYDIFKRTYARKTK